jgi:hypothetical protein
MTSSTGKHELPASPNPDHLRKQAKARLAEMRARAPGARLGEAQLVLAREYGFASWAALQAEAVRRAASPAGAIRRIRRAPASLFPFWRMAETEKDEAPERFFRIGMAVQVGLLVTVLAALGLVELAMAQGLPFNRPLTAHHHQAF